MNKDTKPKPIKDVGTCLRHIGNLQVSRSKYKNAKDAQMMLDKLKSINVVNPLYTVYECPWCHMWHFGAVEWANKI